MTHSFSDVLCPWQPPAIPELPALEGLFGMTPGSNTPSSMAQSCAVPPWSLWVLEWFKDFFHEQNDIFCWGFQWFALELETDKLQSVSKVKKVDKMNAQNPIFDGKTMQEPWFPGNFPLN